jgi:hypothetical protein
VISVICVVHRYFTSCNKAVAIYVEMCSARYREQFQSAEGR